MSYTLVTRILCTLTVLVAVAGLASAQNVSSTPTISRAAGSAVSPNLSDLPTAHEAQGQELKVVPPPKPLPPRGAGPGGTPSQDHVLQHEEGPHFPVNSKNCLTVSLR